jgi:hypothetical protein
MKTYPAVNNDIRMLNWLPTKLRSSRMPATLCEVSCGLIYRSHAHLHKHLQTLDDLDAGVSVHIALVMLGARTKVVEEIARATVDL